MGSLAGRVSQIKDVCKPTQEGPAVRHHITTTLSKGSSHSRAKYQAILVGPPIRIAQVSLCVKFQSYISTLAQDCSSKGSSRTTIALHGLLLVLDP